MADYRHIAYLVESMAPQEYAALKRQFPGSRILGATKTLGAKTKREASGVIDDSTESSTAAPNTDDHGAAQDFCRVGLRVSRESADTLMRRVRGKLGSARILRASGAILAMAASAGVAASILGLFSLDETLTGLTLSGLGFLGSLGAFISDDMIRGGPAGADGRSLLDRLIALQGQIAAATVKFEASGAAGRFSYFDAISDLNLVAKELTQLKSLYSLS